MVLAAVQNTGGRALDLVGALELSAGPGGVRAGPFAASLGTTLAIGDAGSVTILLDRTLPDGPWDAAVTLRSGLLERRAGATISFPDAGAAPPVAITPPGPSSPGLALVAELALVLAIGGGMAGSRGRRARRRRSPQHRGVSDPQPVRGAVEPLRPRPHPRHAG
jgi:hypothetical protein